MQNLKNENYKPGIGVYCDLMKYRLSLAVTFSAGTGYLLSGNPPDADLPVMLAGVFLLASGSACLNQYTERDLDFRMERTRGRPIPSAKMPLKLARRLIILLLATGSCLLAITGIVPLILGILNLIIYNLVYTSLKKRTSFAIIPGALVGTLPPLIGFASAGNPVISKTIVLFSFFMFLWQIPHFWLLLIKYGDEYREAGFVTISDYLTGNQIRIVIFLWVLFTSVFLLVFAGLTGVFSQMFSSILLALNIAFILLFYRIMLVGRESYDTKSAFAAMNSFGFAIMFLLIADALLKLD